MAIIITFLICITILGICFLLFLNENMSYIGENYGMKLKLEELTKRVEDLENFVKELEK